MLPERARIRLVLDRAANAALNRTRPALVEVPIHELLFLTTVAKVEPGEYAIFDQFGEETMISEIHPGDGYSRLVVVYDADGQEVSVDSSTRGSSHIGKAPYGLRWGRVPREQAPAPSGGAGDR